MLRLAGILLLLFSFDSPARGDENIDPVDGAFDRRNVIARLARRMEPDLAGKPERLRQYIDFLQTEIGNDKRLFGFHVEPEVAEGGRVQLRGYIEFPETRAALVAYVGLLGFEVDDKLEALPSADLGDRNLGVMRASRSFSYDAASGRRVSETECLLGEPLYLLREESGHLLAHTSEGYLGYVRSDDVLRLNAAEFAKFMAGPRVRIVADYHTPAGFLIPAGARLKFLAERDHAVLVELPSGDTMDVPTENCEILRERTVVMKSIISRAQQLLGTKYKWGGRSSQGVDCSGLVQLAYAAAGLQLPRDSYQQVYVGQLSATRWHRDGLQPGDTLYFLGKEGKIRHTGLYLGDDRFIQAVMPVVRISSLNPEHEDYDAGHAKSFAFAKRPME
jgi:hypothetical protein